jgi:hypothetical protein
MATLSLRFFWLQCLILWQGGFVFYAAVVVPIGTELLASPATQGLITLRVTPWLNAFGVAYLLIAALEQSVADDGHSPRILARWWLWIGLAVGQYLLFPLHDVLLFFMNDGLDYVQMRPQFQFTHGVYLSISTVLWVLALFHAGLTLAAWQNTPSATRRET